MYRVSRPRAEALVLSVPCNISRSVTDTAILNSDGQGDHWRTKMRKIQMYITRSSKDTDHLWIHSVTHWSWPVTDIVIASVSDLKPRQINQIVPWTSGAQEHSLVRPDVGRNGNRSTGESRGRRKQQTCMCIGRIISATDAYDLQC